MDPAERRRCLRELLREFGVEPNKFSDDELDGLSREGYEELSDFRRARREGLQTAGLRAARADQILDAAAGGGGSGATDVDDSANFGTKLLQPSLEAPPALEDLTAFLAKAPSALIPITSEALSFARLSPELQQCFTAASGRLARAVASSLTSTLIFGPSEMWTVCVENTVVIALLLELDAVLPAGVRLGMVAERDQQDSTSLMTVKSQGGTSLRPDGVLRDNAGLRMLAKWEDKSVSLLAAVNDLHKKTAIWTPLYYGDIKYLPCFAAAGSQLQFYAIAGQGGLTLKPRAVSAVLKLDNMNDRAQAVVTTIKFYQLLRAQRARYPDDVLSAGSESRASHPCGFSRALLFRTDELAVRKRLSPWEKFAAYSGVDFGRLKDLYSTTAQQQGVVHAVQGVPTLQGDLYSVDLVPVGLQPNTVPLLEEDDARHMVHGLLHGLATIHNAGFVHRDLRWDNVACCSAGHRWFLLDLETCAPADEVPVANFVPAGWQRGVTLVHGRYTRASDLFQLGLVVEEKCRRLVASAAGMEFLGAILTHPKDQQLSAARLLSHAWLRCEGVNCRAAGAQPGER